MAGEQPATSTARVSLMSGSGCWRAAVGRGCERAARGGKSAPAVGKVSFTTAGKTTAGRTMAGEAGVGSPGPAPTSMARGASRVRCSALSASSADIVRFCERALTPRRRGTRTRTAAVLLVADDLGITPGPMAIRLAVAEISPVSLSAVGAEDTGSSSHPRYEKTGTTRELIE